MKTLLIISIFSFYFLGCASMSEQEQAQAERELTPVPAPQPAAPPAPAPVAETPKSEDATEEMVKYSDLNNLAPPADREYRRMTRQRMEDESALNSNAGSLWKMEGQSSYLFAENKHRREGDATNIKMEGSALKTIESKAWVVNDLLGQLEEQKRQAEEDSKKDAELKQRMAQLEEEKKLRAERIARGEIVVDPMEEEEFAAAQKAQLDAVKRGPASDSGPTLKKEKEEKIDLKEVERIPVRIVEKPSADTYRIRGQQMLTIKKKQYKVIATALVRAEDFNDAEISSNKLLEAQYDLVHVKRGANE